MRRHRMSGSRRSVPRPEHGASSRTQSNDAVSGRADGVRLHDLHRRGAPERGPSCASRSTRRPADVGGDDEAPVAHGGGHGRGLAARRRAGVEHAFARVRGDEQRHELRRLVLHDEQSRRGQRRQQRVPVRDDRGVGREAARLDSTPCAASDSASAAPSCAACSREGSAAPAVVEPQPRFGRLEAVAIQPARGEPARVRERDGEVVERGGAVARDRPGRGGSGKWLALATDAAQDAR